MRHISVLGTSSDCGKSSISLAICAILADEGFRVSPFKAQNMSNNACVTDDGGEIGVAQYTQAVMLGIPTTYRQNPILLKPQKDGESQVIVNGKSIGAMSAKEYFLKTDEMKKEAEAAFCSLSEGYDVLVCEGAGSPVELNIMQKDISNLYIADRFDTKILLVADIERGGVFASIYGTYELLPQKLKQNVIGVVINKFRGDLSLFSDGVKIIKERFGLDVLWVVPYAPQNIGFEDSMSIKNYQNSADGGLKIAVVKLPRISNFTDFEPLFADTNLSVWFTGSVNGLKSADIVVLPGSKATIEDLRWLKKNGIFDFLKAKNVYTVGICGGYQMMFKRLVDEGGVENLEPCVEEGLGFIDDEIVFLKDKTVTKGSYEIMGESVAGYEIHCGISKKFPLYASGEGFFGTHLHAVFDDDGFRERFFAPFTDRYEGYSFLEYKRGMLKSFADTVKQSIDYKKIIEALSC